MNTFRLTVSSPDGNIFDSEAVSLIARGVEGEFAILAGHAPFITSIIPCECRIELEDGEEKTGLTEGGILTVSREGVTLLSGSFRWKDKE